MPVLSKLVAASSAMKHAALCRYEFVCTACRNYVHTLNMTLIYAKFISVSSLVVWYSGSRI